MTPFQNIIVGIALVILIICLIMIGVTLYNNKYNAQSPPVVSDCPDWWLDLSDGNASNCQNVKDLGNADCPKTMNFSNSYWTGDQGLCNKYNWANRCNLTWDGVTNNPNACDASKNEQSSTNPSSTNPNNEGGPIEFSYNPGKTTRNSSAASAGASGNINAYQAKLNRMAAAKRNAVGIS